MRERPTFRAALIHTSGPEVGLRESVEMPMLSTLPPETLRRPVNLGGTPSFEEWSLVSLEQWRSDPPVAAYKLTGHTHRDPNQRPDMESGRILPWRR